MLTTCTPLILLRKYKETEDENDGAYSETVTYKHKCSSCGHEICEHFYEFEADGRVQEYLMECPLCGRGSHTVQLEQRLEGFRPDLSNQEEGTSGLEMEGREKQQMEAREQNAREGKEGDAVDTEPKTVVTAKNAPFLSAELEALKLAVANTASLSDDDNDDDDDW